MSRVRIYSPRGLVWDYTEAQPEPQACPCCGQPAQLVRPPSARGVQVILQADPGVGWAMATGSDYYIRWPGRGWVGVDIFGLFDWLIESGQVLFGRTITNAEYQAIFNQAKADKSLPEKAGFLSPRKERVP